LNPDPRLPDLFAHAVELEGEMRAAWLAELRGKDDALAREIEELLASAAAGDRRFAAPAWQTPELRIDERYRLNGEIGRGGMGRVFVAHDRKLGRDVAIKVLPPGEHSAEQVLRLEQEARATCALNHPNILAVYDIGRSETAPYIVSELLHGDTLRAQLRSGPLPPAEALSLALQLADGLAAAHDKAIVHRDLKPENLFVTTDGRLKILDFGVAKLLPDQPGGPQTRTGAIVGTLGYMSPEQSQGTPADLRSDIFSFGAILYEMLSGKRAFAGESAVDVAYAVVHHDPSPVHGLPPALGDVIRRCLEKDPARRFESARELPGALRACDFGAARMARAFPAAGLPRRPRLALALAGIAALAVAAGLLSSLGLRRLAQDTRDRSIAVLPLSSAGDESGYLAQGIHDELLRQLSRVGDLQVISRTSVLRYKDAARNIREIGEALGVGAILEGSVQRIGNRVRVEAKLIDARRDRQIWADRYDRDVTDVFAIQTAVAEEIVAALHARLLPEQKAQLERKPTENPAAYDDYLRALGFFGRKEWRAGTLDAAAQTFRKAVAADPSFALARAKLAQTLLTRLWYGQDVSASLAESARQEAEHALRLQPDLPEGHLAMGYFHYYGRRAYGPALQEFEIARKGSPAEATLAIGYVQRRMGKFEEAARNLETVSRLDPHSGVPLEVAKTLFYLRRYEEADRRLERLLADVPDMIVAGIARALVRAAWTGETELARRVLPQLRGKTAEVTLGRMVSVLLSLDPREALRVIDSLESDALRGQGGVLPKAFLRGIAYEALGDAELARSEYLAALPAIEAEVDRRPAFAQQHSVLARAYAAVGRKQDALREADRAVSLVPISDDAIDGTFYAIERAQVEARVGESDAAIAHIRELLAIPCPLSPALLRLDPAWRFLRDDPRFRELAGI